MIITGTIADILSRAEKGPYKRSVLNFNAHRVQNDEGDRLLA